MKTDLIGKVVLLTGASAGIGEALAREFAARGAAVVLTARRVERLQALADELNAQGRRALAVAADVTVDGDLERAVAAAREAFGAVDIAVANAGFGVAGRMDKLSLEDYRRQFETNVFGVLRTVYAALPELEKVRGRVVVIGSVAGYIAAPGGGPYAMSKYAVRALAESLGRELAPKGVSVTHIGPGFVESEIRKVDNAGNFREAARDSVPGWLMMPASQAAREIVDATAARRREAIITRHGRAVVFLARHAPGFVDRVLRALPQGDRPAWRR